MRHKDVIKRGTKGPRASFPARFFRWTGQAAGDGPMRFYGLCGLAIVFLILAICLPLLTARSGAQEPVKNPAPQQSNSGRPVAPVVQPKPVSKPTATKPDANSEDIVPLGGTDDEQGPTVPVNTATKDSRPAIPAEPKQPLPAPTGDKLSGKNDDDNVLPITGSSSGKNEKNPAPKVKTTGGADGDPPPPTAPGQDNPKVTKPPVVPTPKVDVPEPNDSNNSQPPLITLGTKGDSNKIGIVINPVVKNKPSALVPVSQPDGNAILGLQKPPAFRLLDQPKLEVPTVGQPQPILPGPTTVTSEKPSLVESAKIAGPALTLEKIAPSNFAAQETFSYELVLRNVGGSAAFMVRLEDMLHPDLRVLEAEPKSIQSKDRLTWNIGTLPAGAMKRIQVKVESSRQLDVLPPARVTFSIGPEIPLATKTSAPLALHIHGPQKAGLGDQAIFQIEIVNNSAKPYKQMLLRAKLSSGLTHPHGKEIEAELQALGPKETRKITLKTKVSEPGKQSVESIILIGKMEIVKSWANVEIGEKLTPASLIVPDAESKLSIRQIAPRQAFLDRAVDVMIEVVNSSNKDSENLLVRNELAQGVEFVAAGDGGQFNANSRFVDWRLPILRAGKTRRLIVRIQPKREGSLANRVLLPGQAGGDCRSDATIQVGGLATLALEITGKDRQVEVGAETEFEIRVRNQGSVAGTNIQIIAMLSDGIMIRAADGPCKYRFRGREVTFEALPKLEPNKEVRFRILALGKVPGDCRCRVQMTSDQLQLPLCKEETTLVYRDKN